jgi:hypothetical protein
MTIRPLSMRRALCATVLVTSVSACEFIDPITENPNTVPVATLDQLLVSTTVTTFDWSIGPAGYIWLQQIDETRPTSAWSTYDLLRIDADEEYRVPYSGLVGVNIGKSGGGGLNDLRTGIEQAEALGRRTYAGIFKVYEAYLVGIAASLFGDVAYSEAVTTGVQQPVLDPQRDVYASLFVLLDEAIADLQSGEGANPGATDLVFGGDATRRWPRPSRAFATPAVTGWPTMRIRSMSGTRGGGGGEEGGGGWRGSTSSSCSRPAPTRGCRITSARRTATGRGCTWGRRPACRPEIPAATPRASCAPITFFPPAWGWATARGTSISPTSRARRTTSSSPRPSTGSETKPLRVRRWMTP